MKTIAIIQARLGSTRLKNKMLLPLCGAPLIQRVIERVQRADLVDLVVVASPGTYENLPIVTIANRCGVHAFAYDGDENDVVGRFLSAATGFGADLIVRIPGDNPCVMPDKIDYLVDTYMAFPKVFMSNTIARADCEVLVDGIGAEIFSYNRLQWLDRITQSQPDYREHPHKYFEIHNEIWWPHVPPMQHWQHVPSADLRLDVNTQSDYDFIADLYDALWPANNNFTITDILTYLETKKVAV